MATLESMRRRISGAEDMYAVVRVMKALAAANIRQCEKTVESIGLYNRTIDQGFQILMRNAGSAVREALGVTNRGATAGQSLAATAPLATALIVCGSDQGMCGSFNEQIASHAMDEMRRHQLPLDRTPVIAVGLRLQGRLEDLQATVQRTFSLPTAITGVTGLVQQLFREIDRMQTQQSIRRFWVVHQRLTSSASFAPHRAQVLPLDWQHLQQLAAAPWPSRSLPTFAMDWSALLSVLIRQHLYAVLHRALAESMASENASRLASMQAAEKNIEEHLEKLQLSYHQKRQQTITEELLDIVAGFESIEDPSVFGKAKKRKNKFPHSHPGNREDSGRGTCGVWSPELT